MHQSLGPQFWWPGETPLEISVGAILTQNTAWTNVEKAILNLKKAKLLYHHQSTKKSLAKGQRDRLDKVYLARLKKIPVKRLARFIQPAGYYNIKAKRLKNFFDWVTAEYGSLAEMYKTPLNKLRLQLLSVNGIGPETADSILLYGGNKPVFVIDTYTKRILSRHHLAESTDAYEDLQALFMKNIPQKTQMYNEFHALLVNVGKNYCKTRKPLCQECPLGTID